MNAQWLKKTVSSILTMLLCMVLLPANSFGEIEEKDDTFQGVFRSFAVDRDIISRDDVILYSSYNMNTAYVVSYLNYGEGVDLISYSRAYNMYEVKVAAKNLRGYVYSSDITKDNSISGASGWIEGFFSPSPTPPTVSPSPTPAINQTQGQINTTLMSRVTSIPPTPTSTPKPGSTPTPKQPSVTPVVTNDPFEKVYDPHDQFPVGATGTVVINGDLVDVRNRALNGDVIFKVNKGESYYCLGDESSGWYKVKLPTGETGYVSPNFSTYLENEKNRMTLSYAIGYIRNADGKLAATYGQGSGSNKSDRGKLQGFPRFAVLGVLKDTGWFAVMRQNHDVGYFEVVYVNPEDVEREYFD